MNFIRRTKKGRGFLGAFKLDMEKAYDRVRWSFVRSVQENMEFSDQWVKLILECITMVSYNLLINGEIVNASKTSSRT